MTFPEALVAAHAGKLVTRPAILGGPLAWVTGASTAAGDLPALKPFLALVPASGGLITYQPSMDDMAAADWSEVKG